MIQNTVMSSIGILPVFCTWHRGYSAQSGTRQRMLIFLSRSCEGVPAVAQACLLVVVEAGVTTPATAAAAATHRV